MIEWIWKSQKINSWSFNWDSYFYGSKNQLLQLRKSNGNTHNFSTDHIMKRKFWPFKKFFPIDWNFSLPTVFTFQWKFPRITHRKRSRNSWSQAILGRAVISIFNQFCSKVHICVIVHYKRMENFLPVEGRRFPNNSVTTIFQIKFWQHLFHTCKFNHI